MTSIQECSLQPNLVFLKDTVMSDRIEIRSEITGTVWKVNARPGDKVSAGDAIIVIESMKMEIPVIAEDGGTVVEVLVSEKSPVSEGQVVAIIAE